jgi:hypothetical protein
MRRLLLIAAALVGVAAGIACGDGGGAPDKFTRDCTVRGGHVQKAGPRGKVCLPPVGGWQ